jgi:hypothetical protein
MSIVCIDVDHGKVVLEGDTRGPKSGGVSPSTTRKNKKENYDTKHIDTTNNM